MIEFKKIDKRYKAGHHYKYIIKFSIRRGSSLTVGDSIKKFNEVRQWCIDTWGMSCEVDDAWAMIDVEKNGIDYPVWCWLNDRTYGNRLIYLKTDKEYMLAQLRWN